MTKQEIEEEKASLEETNADLTKVIAEAQKEIHWNKKRIKIAEAQLKEMPETAVKVIQDISKGL